MTLDRVLLMIIDIAMFLWWIVLPICTILYVLWIQ